MRILTLPILSFALLACSVTASESAQSDPIPVEPNGGIGDGLDRPMLQAMTYEEFSGPIEMGMGCSFSTENDTGTLFAATAPDSDKVHGKAAIKINDTIVVLTHKGMGIAQVEAGGMFASEAIEVTIEHPGGEPSSDSPESYFWPAVLKIAQDEGGSNLYEGVYSCGA